MNACQSSQFYNQLKQKVNFLEKANANQKCYLLPICYTIFSKSNLALCQRHIKYLRPE